MRVLRSSAVKITSPTFVADDGETPEACASTPTATVTHEDGTVLAALTPAAGADTGTYVGTLTATHTANLGRLTVLWTGTVAGLVQVYRQEFEVVGAHYVSLPDIRNERDMDNTTKFPTSLLIRERDKWATRVEEICGVSFVRRYKRETICGDGTDRLRLVEFHPRTVLAVSIDGVAQTVGNFTLQPAASTITSEHGLFTFDKDCVITYEHGFDAPPGDVRTAVLAAIVRDIKRTTQDLPSDAISSTFDGGPQIRYSTPNAAQGRPTGILELDAVLAQHNYHAPAVG